MSGCSHRIAITWRYEAQSCVACGRRVMTFATCFAAIVLLLDTSASVSDRLYAAQRDGTAAAFETPRLVQAIEDHGGIAVMVVEFGFVALVRLEWTLVRRAVDAAAFASAVRSLQRSGRNGNTAIGHALARAQEELRSVPCRPEFQIIDISTDGEESMPRMPVRQVRESAVAAEIVVNAIVFPSSVGADTTTETAVRLVEAEAWLRENVATGFVRVAVEEDGFVEAFRNKLVHELTELRPSHP